MNDRDSLGDRLIAIETLSSNSRQQLEQELHTMFIRQLKTPGRIFFAIVGIASLGVAVLCGYLALTQTRLPVVPRVGLGIGTLFGLAWAALAARVCQRSALDLKVDARRMAAMVWVFTTLMMVTFLMAGMSVPDRQFGVQLIVYGLTFLVGAGVYFLSYRIEQAELNTRERLLQLELRIAELAERR